MKKEILKKVLSKIKTGTSFDFDSEVNLELTDLPKNFPVKHDYLYSYTDKVYVKWNAEFIVRDWGFNISVYVPDQEIKIDYKIDKSAIPNSIKLLEKFKKESEQEFTLNVSDVEIDYGSNNYNQVGLVATELSYWKGKWTFRIQTSAA